MYQRNKMNPSSAFELFFLNFWSQFALPYAFICSDNNIFFKAENLIKLGENMGKEMNKDMDLFLWMEICIL